MGQVTFAINGRTYRIGCADGEEARLRQLAREVATRVDGLVMEFGQVGEARLLLMAALLVTDELLDARANLEVLVAEAAERLHLAAEAAPKETAAAKSSFAPRHAADIARTAKPVEPQQVAATEPVSEPATTPTPPAPAVEASREAPMVTVTVSTQPAAGSAQAKPSRQQRIEIPGKLRHA